MTSSGKELIRLNGIGRTFKNGDIEFTALKKTNLIIYQGEFTAIMGASGSGKSTMMNILGCLDRPTTGEYYFEEKNITPRSNTELALLRRQKFGFIFQSYNLLPRTTVYDNVELPLLYGSGLGSKIRREKVAEALRQVGLEEKSGNLSNQLSGGQQQRVAIARALINSPEIIFADEPTGNLDTRTSYEIMAIFQKLNSAGTTIVMVTHEKDISDFAGRNIVFKDGRIISDSINTLPVSAQKSLAEIPVESNNQES